MICLVMIFESSPFTSDDLISSLLFMVAFYNRNINDCRLFEKVLTQIVDCMEWTLCLRVGDDDNAIDNDGDDGDDDDDKDDDDDDGVAIDDDISDPAQP